VGTRPSAPDAMTLAKKELRLAAQARRDALSDAQRESAGAAIVRALEAFPGFRAAKVVLAFMAMRGEVDLLPLMERNLDKGWGIPRIVRVPEPHIEFHAYDPQLTVEHPYGMLEPLASLPPIDPAAVDLVLVPGLAFSPEGHRLGYGGGYYDRFLPLVTRALRVGVAYREQIVDEIPHHEADQRVQYLATEDGIWTCAAAGGGRGMKR
jgi:5-formyltetrahydrofolate cyclo-ligase